MVDDAMWVRGPQARSAVDRVHLSLSSLWLMVHQVQAGPREGCGCLPLSRGGALVDSELGHSRAMVAQRGSCIMRSWRTSRRAKDDDLEARAPGVGVVAGGGARFDG